MELGMIGLGRMGANMVERLMKAGHHCVVYDSHADAVQHVGGKGREGHHESCRTSSRPCPSRAPSG